MFFVSVNGEGEGVLDGPDPAEDPAGDPGGEAEDIRDDAPGTSVSLPRRRKSKLRRRGLRQGRSRDRPPPTLFRRGSTTPCRVRRAGKSNFRAPSAASPEIFTISLQHYRSIFKKNYSPCYPPPPIALFLTSTQVSTLKLK